MLVNTLNSYCVVHLFISPAKATCSLLSCRRTSSKLFSISGPFAQKSFRVVLWNFAEELNIRHHGVELHSRFHTKWKLRNYHEPSQLSISSRFNLLATFLSIISWILMCILWDNTVSEHDGRKRSAEISNLCFQLVFYPCHTDNCDNKTTMSLYQWVYYLPVTDPF